jgi:hypothetical protein
VNRLPAQPTGASLIADLMGSYFTSSDAWDRCYRAQILRDYCRTLDNSAEQPRRETRHERSASAPRERSGGDEGAP